MSKFSVKLIEQILATACTIQAIPAPTFQESKRADYFLSQFYQHELQDVHIDRVGNVLGRIPGASGMRPLVVSAHIDHVHPTGTPLTVHCSGDRITGPGIADNALGSAALLGLIWALRDSKVDLPGDLWLVMNVGEEGLGDLRGMKAVVDRFQDSALAYIVVEGMGLGIVIHRGLGVERYLITVCTPGGHSWVDYGSPSAIHELCKLVTSLNALKLPRDPCTILNVGVIHGGTSVNTIAAEAWAELDLRSEDEAALASLTGQVQTILHAACQANIQVKLEEIGKRSAGGLPNSHPLVQLAVDILVNSGIKARLEIASTDANVPLSRGYPAICIGITNGNHAHTQAEYILTGQVDKGFNQLYQIVTQSWEKLS